MLAREVREVAMKWINGYLMFDGNCREAVEFYKDCLGAELSVSNFTDEQAPGAAGRVMHARLASGGGLLMASDCAPGRGPIGVGENVRLAIECDGVEELDRVFAALSSGGTVTMPVQDMFWGARFGMLKDRYGVHWMLNHDLPKEQRAG